MSGRLIFFPKKIKRGLEKLSDWIYFILDRFQISKMREIVHSIDEKAYITITEVADVFKTNI